MKGREALRALLMQHFQWLRVTCQGHHDLCCLVFRLRLCPGLSVGCQWPGLCNLILTRTLPLKSLNRDSGARRGRAAGGPREREGEGAGAEEARRGCMARDPS
eukprot:1721857-Rhodomonas_salina.1